MMIKTKLFTGLAISMLLIALAFGIIVSSFNREIEHLRDTAKEQMNYVKLATAVKNQTDRISEIIREMLLDPEREQWDLYTAEITDLRQKNTDMLAELERLTAGKTTEQNIKRIKDLHEKYGGVRIQVQALARVDSQKAVQLLREEGKPIHAQLAKETEELGLVITTMLEETLRELNTSFLHIVRTGIFLFLGAFLISISIMFWVIKGINRSIGDVLRVFRVITLDSMTNLPRVEKVSDDELGEIGHSYNALAGSLEEQAKRASELRKQTEEQKWMMELGEIAVSSEAIVTREDLAAQVVSKLAKVVGANFGAMYFMQKEKHNEMKLTHLGGYALDQNETACQRDFLLGEGVIGQCANDKESIVVKDVPENYIRITSGLGDAPPREIIAVPAIFNGEVYAVIELASFGTFTPLQTEFLKQAAGNIAVTLDRIGDRLRIENLLRDSQSLTEELQSQSEELQLQQEELRNINEQLHDQYKQADQQMRELRAVKNELMDKAQQLELGSKYKSEFLANMSHELRTPLNSMMLLSQVLRENKNGNLTQNEISYVETIYQAGQDLLYLINDILDLSKVESGTLLIIKSEIDMRKLIDAFDLEFRPIAEEKGLEFRVQIDNNLPGRLYSDEQRLKQILINLLTNAVKFTDHGTVTFAMSQQINEQGVPVIAFAVIDTGIGIAPENQEAVFEAFRQVDGTIRRRHGGTGLGLSICRKLAELLGGYIILDSTLNQGSTFTLYLPAYVEAQSLMKEAACSLTLNSLATNQPEFPTALDGQEKQETLVGSGEGNRKILLVDDDVRNIYALTGVLESMDLGVVVAENGREAVQIVEERDDIGLILMDIMMPEMDGFEAIKRIRQNPSRIALPIIALTAKAMRSDREQCLQVGASDYICKPINVEQLQSLIKVWLSK